MSTILNLVAMQISWFACVLGAANGMPWLGVIVSLIVVTQHLIRSKHRLIETKLVASALLLGLILDSALATAGLVSFNSGIVVAGATTPWMLALWMSFATALTGSLRWIVDRMGISVAFGIVGGPLAYWSGAKLGAITLADSPLTFACIGLGWGAAMLVFSILVKHLNTASTAEAFA